MKKGLHGADRTFIRGRLGTIPDSFSEVFGAARKFSQTFAGEFIFFSASFWRGPHVSEGFSRAHDWLLALKTGEPTRSSGPLAGAAPESGLLNVQLTCSTTPSTGIPRRFAGKRPPFHPRLLVTLQGASLRRRRLSCAAPTLH